MHNDINERHSIHQGLDNWKPGSYRFPFLYNSTLLILVFWNCLVAVHALVPLIHILRGIFSWYESYLTS